ncbi:hypothetical protein [Bifidobacterium vansinderenii]|uniref:hypothetical protein n=1 Tax=Bifidobacterium vansinderenii TaxID=1984871 RepID=UPI000B8AF777|nr:hypothetical protein [Bifidobacterium vansinderenii]
MSNTAWISSVTALKQLPATTAAIEVGKELTDLWPLHDHVQIDNDVKYAESFQVRVTRQFAIALTDEDVTMPDAEYVYEGADEIPGRPQTLVDALLNANDAYDTTVDFSEDGNAERIVEAAAQLGDVWDDDTVAAARELIAAAAAEGSALAADDLPGRYALGAAAFAQMLALTAGDDEETALKAALPAVLYFNEFDEWLGVPRVFLDLDTVKQLREIALAGPENDGAAKFIDVLAEPAATEWRKHREDVLWDPAEAKKKAREEDEAKSKAALAAKFAHIKDDPSKETVEL